MENAVILSSIPGRYVRALFEVGKKQNIFNELLNNVEIFEKFYCNNKYLFPKYGKKTSDICDLVGEILDLQPCFVSFLKVLAENRRLSNIANIALIFRKTVMQSQGKKDVKILSIEKLTFEQQNKVTELVRNLFNTSVNIKYVTDTSLLSGIIIDTDGIRIDISGREVLRQLEKYYISLGLL